MREKGQALIETLLFGVLLLIPLLWLLVVLADVHRGALATAAAAREAGTAAARSSDIDGAARAIRSAVHSALVDHGVDPDRTRLRWRADAQLARGGTVEVLISYSVPVFQLPLLGGLGQPSVTINARHLARVDPYRSRAR